MPESRFSLSSADVVVVKKDRPTRIITPEYCNDSFVVLALVSDPNNSYLQELLSYVVPVANDTVPIDLGAHPAGTSDLLWHTA